MPRPLIGVCAAVEQASFGVWTLATGPVPAGRAGGSRTPEELAQLVELDLTDPSIWASGLDALGEELDEAERLADELAL